MAEYKEFSEEEHITVEAREDILISGDSQNELISNTSQNDEENEHNQTTGAHETALQKRLNIESSINELQEVINSLLQQKSKLLDIKKELEKGSSSLMKDLEKILENSHDYFLKYREVYKKCESALENLFQKAELRLNLPNIAGHHQENICTYFPILHSRNLAAYIVSHTSAKMAFENFKSETERGFTQGSDKKIDYLTTAIDQADIAYNKLRSIVFYEV